jgi:hypothetical protein
MPLKSGYSHATFSANLAELIRAGHERNAAIMTAASKARQSFFKRFPAGALPNWLAFPKANRTAQFYDGGGRPMIGRNPVEPDRAALSKATALYQGFTGKAPRKVHQLNIPPLPKAALAIGKVFGIMYSVDATGERFHHEFKSKAQPLLVVSPDGHQVFLHGGAFTFTKRGFVDH